ncbi:MAG: ATP-binding cassette domain-containing protein [Xanthomonadaceae bacterium]|jgi:ATP-binding cassette subfamily B protein|nr:ATP-binding cassette domain-containing protein [Xanthomonadaceae bacterium]
MTDAVVRPKSQQGLKPLAAVLPHVRRYRGLIVAWLTFLALSSAATLTLPVAVRFVIDEGFRAADAAYVDRAFLLLLGVAVVLAVATALRFFFVSSLGERVAADLRRAVYDRLLGLDQAFYESTRTGELLSRLTTDTELVQTVVGSGASVAVRSAVTLAGASIALVWTSPKLAGYAALVIPLILLPMILFGRRVRGLSRESQDRIADTSALASETLNAIHTVQSYTREARMSARFGEAVLSTLETARRRIRTRSLLTAVVILLVFGAITAVLWVGAREVLSGAMQPGQLAQFLLFAVMVAGSVAALVEVWGDVQRAAGAMERIGELLAQRPAIADPETPTTLVPPIRGGLRFEGVRFHYPSRPDRAALDDITLDIRPGETVALVGPSGAGKTTMFQLLLRFHDPQAGRILLDGHDLRALPLAIVRGATALVPQDTVIFGASAADNIRVGRDAATLDAVQAAARAAEAHEFISAQPQGYDTYLGERGVRLSGGQQQRIAIARAILKNAPILLLDEATSALDAQSEAAIQAALERLMENRTTLVIAHRLATVLKADRIVVMDGGRIVAQGRHAELLAQGGLYAELARLQFTDAPRAAAAMA